MTDEAIAAWTAEPRTTRSEQRTYSALAILTALTLRAVFRLALRQTERLIGSVMQLLRLDLAVCVHVLDRMLELGNLNSVRIPRIQAGLRSTHPHCRPMQRRPGCSNPGQPRLQFKECCPSLRHGLDKQGPVEKQVTRLTAGFGDEKAAMTGCAVGGPIVSVGGGIVVGAHWVAAAHLEPA